MHHRLLALLVPGLLLLFSPAAAPAAPANVKLRIEGSAATLLPRTALRTDTHTVNKDGVAGHDCTGTSVAGALDIGLGGDWGGTWFGGLGYSVERIKGETHAFPQPDFFEVRVNNRSLSVGVCSAELQEGDDVLLFVARCEFDPVSSTCANPPVLPLGIGAPATVAPGVPFDVSVVAYAGDGQASPVAGATVTGGDAAATTNAAGVAALTLSAGGAATLRATKAGSARSDLASVCATTGADGHCGTSAPGAGTPPGQSCDTTGDDGRCGTRDRRAPAARIVGIAEGRRFVLGRAPRELKVAVDPDPSGILAVKLRLTRSHRGRCTTFSGRRERFVRVPCGAAKGFWFAVGDREQTSYLLPRALPAGRYVLDAKAIDRAYNRDDARRRGANRIVFHVVARRR